MTEKGPYVTYNLASMPMPARTIGDHQAEYVTLLGILAATGRKIGREIYTPMKQEFGELEAMQTSMRPIAPPAS